MIFYRPISLWVICLAFGLFVRSGQCAGTITNCTEVALRRALAGGGVVTCNCDGTINLTNPIVFTNDVTLQAPGHIVEISGGTNHIRLIVINRGVSLTINHIALSNGYTSPTNSPTGSIPGWDGGAIYNDRGNLIIVSGSLIGNVANGQNGLGGDPRIMNGGNGQEGGPGRGGAIFNNGGVVVLSTTTFSSNKAVGGSGGNGAAGAGSGNGPTGGNGGSGGPGRGAAIFNANAGTLIINNSTLSSNLVTGAAGGLGGTGLIIGFNGRNGFSGDGAGGALFNENGQVTILNTTFAANSAQGGAATNELQALRREEGVTGRDGGNAFGGAIYNANGNLAITNSTFSANGLIGGTGGAGGRGGTNVLGANGGAGGTGGFCQGGCLYDSGSNSVFLVSCTISDSSLTGGTGGAGGAPGGPLGTSGASGAMGSVSGGAIFVGPLGNVFLGNTILTHRLGSANIAGTTTDLGGNLNSDGSLTITESTSRNNAIPLLGILTTNGGPTLTMAISSNSPAIDAANERLCLPFDQRGQARVGHCDIGAYEYQGSIAPVPIGLAAARTSTNSIVVSWRSDALNYQLITSGNLSNWTIFRDLAVTNNGLKSVTIIPTNRIQFFELTRP